VTGGGVSRDDTCWHPARPSYFAPETAIAKLVRGKVRAWFAQKRPDLITPATVWTTPWVVKITRWGEGENAVLRYLARYVFRIAITNSRILALDERTVSFRYKHRQSNRWRICSLDGEDFMRRFLQHVLPKALHKVRYFDVGHGNRGKIANTPRRLLHMQGPNDTPPEGVGNPAPSVEHPHQPSTATADLPICPRCGLGQLLFVRKLLPKQPQGP